ncbi:MAG: type I-C CRISPR-associated protein Cas8c/Csd1 [Candidatus Competibacteraceae bacterium]|jgi:CRISPR-associated protein Csd1|nr:type I-C CRISPR-associated protein Cas8c/Csd1 [Candidatus Competibacteraceae bacterium]
MILQSLQELYRRLGDELPEPGFERKEIPFIIVLDSEGNFVDLEDTRTGEGKKKVGRFFVVPQGEKKAAGILANLLWDTCGYVLGIVSGTKAAKLSPEKLLKEQSRTEKMHAAFIQRIRDTFADPEADAGIRTVLNFLEKQDFTALEAHPNWPDLKDSTGITTFRLAGENELICQRRMVRHAIACSDSGNESSYCLVSGENDRIARLHPAIRGVWGAQAAGGNIVSFNFGATESYNKKQGANAPVGESTVFSYTTALNHLLRKGSRQRMQVGDASTVFWAEKSHPVDDDFLDWIESDEDDPAQRTNKIRALYAAPKTGVNPLDEDTTKFFVLGLAPNNARLAVRFWHQTTVGDLAYHIRQHFDDLRLEHGPQASEYPKLSRLLASTALQSKLDNVIPNLAGEVMRAILAGTPYPRTLLSAALRRIRAEQKVTYERAALIKAVLARNTRLSQTNQQEVAVSLDENNINTGYRLGRLFAVLERAQEAASPGINATIRDRFYGSASATPVTVFPHLLKLKNHHIAKLDNRGQAVNLEKLIGQIVDEISDLPGQLSLEDQGRFAIGYYHQRQAFYRKKENPADQGEE